MEINELMNTYDGILFEDFIYYKLGKKVGSIIDGGYEGDVFSLKNDPKRVIKFTTFRVTNIKSNLKLLNKKIPQFIQLYNIGKIEFPENIKLNLRILNSKYNNSKHNSPSLEYIKKNNMIYYIIMERGYPIRDELRKLRQHLYDEEFFQKSFNMEFNGNDVNADICTFIEKNFIESKVMYEYSKDMNDFFIYLKAIASEKLKNSKMLIMFIQILNIIKTTFNFFNTQKVDLHDDQILKNYNGKLILCDIGTKDDKPNDDDLVLKNKYVI